MKTWLKLIFVAVIAIFSTLIMIGCEGCEQEPPPFKTEFKLTAWNNKTITVLDKRANPKKQLDELGIIVKLQEAVNRIGTVGDDNEYKQGFNSMLGKVKIVVKDPDGTFNEWKTNPSANELWVNFDWLNNPATNNIFAGLFAGISIELAKGNDAHS